MDRKVKSPSCVGFVVISPGLCNHASAGTKTKENENYVYALALNRANGDFLIIPVCFLPGVLPLSWWRTTSPLWSGHRNPFLGMIKCGSLFFDTREGIRRAWLHCVMYRRAVFLSREFCPGTLSPSWWKLISPLWFGHLNRLGTTTWGFSSISSCVVSSTSTRRAWCIAIWWA